MMTAGNQAATQAKPRKALLLVNGNARAGDLGERAARLLMAAGFSIERPATGSADDLLAAIRHHGPSMDMVVVGGGDGTISAAAPAMLEIGRPLGILPLGTANDLARSLGIPANLEDAVGILARGRARLIDVGMVDGRPFFNAVNVGLGAEVAIDHGGEAKKRLGVWNYPRVIWQSWSRRKLRRVSIRCDGTTHHGRFLHIAVVNGRYHGGGIPASPDATIEDGLLHLYGIKARSLLGLLKVIPPVLLGRGTGPELIRLAGKRLRIETRHPADATADGEPIGTTPLDLECQKDRIELIVP